MAGLDPAIQGVLLHASVLLLWMAASVGGHDVEGFSFGQDDKACARRHFQPARGTRVGRANKESGGFYSAALQFPG
jgi:hypothetical protein